MIIQPTAGIWRPEDLHRSNSDWPFDWRCEVTAFDPETETHKFVGTICQSGARPYAEALANARAMGAARTMMQILEAVAKVIDMSDPEHALFADSAADCLDELLCNSDDIRRVLAFIRTAGPGAAQHISPILRAYQSG